MPSIVFPLPKLCKVRQEYLIRDANCSIQWHNEAKPVRWTIPSINQNETVENPNSDKAQLCTSIPLAYLPSFILIKFKLAEMKQHITLRTLQENRNHRNRMGITGQQISKLGSYLSLIQTSIFSDTHYIVNEWWNHGMILDDWEPTKDVIKYCNHILEVSIDCMYKRIFNHYT